MGESVVSTELHAASIILKQIWQARSSIQQQLSCVILIISKAGPICKCFRSVLEFLTACICRFQVWSSSFSCGCYYSAGSIYISSYPVSNGEQDELQGPLD